MMTLQTALIWMAGFLALPAVLALAAVWLEKEFPGQEFDERQKIARGNAYRVSFCVGVIYSVLMLVYMIYLVENPPIVEPYLLVLIGVLIQCYAFHVYCLATHAALPFSEKPTLSIVGYLLIGVFQLANFFTRDLPDELPLTGTGTSVWLSLISGCFFLALSFMHLVRVLIREKE